MAWIERGGSLLPIVLRHQIGARLALLAAPAETFLRDIILAGPALFARLANLGLLANALRHSGLACFDN